MLLDNLNGGLKPVPQTVSSIRGTMTSVRQDPQRNYRSLGLVGSCFGGVGLVLLVLRHSSAGAVFLAAALAVVITVASRARRRP